MKTRLGDYIRAAFSACPAGMFVPPNWIGLGVFALLSFASTGFLFLGAGLELAYLYTLISNPRFRRLVDALQLAKAQREVRFKLEAAVARLSEDDLQRYRLLEQRCRSILTQQNYGTQESLRAQAEGLGRLLWIYVKLLLTRQSINRVCRPQGPGEADQAALQKKMELLSDRLRKENITDDLRKSLTGQIDILKQRLDKQQEAAQKLAFLDAELDRVQEQVELVREQAVLSTDPQLVSQRIDEIAATLGGTSQWIREQQQLYGQVENLLEEPPPLTVPAPTQESQ